MNARVYLRQLWEYEKKIQEKREELEELRLSMMGTQGISYGDRVMTSPTMDKIGVIVCKFEIKEKEIEELEKIYRKKRKKIVNQITSIGNQKISVFLYKRYVKHETIKEIADYFGLKENTVKKIQKKSLEIFEKFL